MSIPPDELRAHLERKLETYFPDPEQRAEVERELARYGEEDYEADRDRVRLAILKLAKGDLHEVRCCVKMAKTDFRDVLSYAEYPNQVGSWSKSTQECERLRQLDAEQYREWLEEE